MRVQSSFFKQEKNIDVRGLPIASVLSSDSLKKNVLLTSCTNEFSDPDVYQSPPLQWKYSWSLAWKFLLLKGQLKQECFKQINPEAFKLSNNGLFDDIAAIPYTCCDRYCETSSPGSKNASIAIEDIWKIKILENIYVLIVSKKAVLVLWTIRKTIFKILLLND